LLSTNAKDIGTLYLIFSLFSGLLGTAFSVLIRMELSGPGVQYIADNQLYNSIITAHALLMSTPFYLVLALLFTITIQISWYVKRNRAGGVELRGATLTAKSILKELFISNLRDLDSNSDLSSVTFRLTNLIRRVLYHNGITVEGWTSTLVDSILSLVLNLLISNGTCRTEDKNLRKKPITKCADKGTRDYLRYFTSGNGAIVVREFLSLERVTTNRKLIRKFSSKAGENTLRGSEKSNQSVKSNISIKDISNFKNLVAGFELIKSKPGNITKGVTGETLSVIDLDYFLTIERRLQDGKFKLGPARRIKIPKPGENSTRPLTMAYIRESIVKKAVQLALEPVYEENFRYYSQGFRPGIKPAIQFLESNFHSSKYIIEADFHKAFPSIPHNKLIYLLKTRIKCEKHFCLICFDLEAGYVELGQLQGRSVSGTPQVSLLSPPLSNVYFHELDKFRDGILKEYSQSKTCRKRKEYESLENKMKY
jgi:retron-type reverse transcriptase